jgi:hypothetical protein
VIVFSSCNKSGTQQPPVVLSTEEYFRYSVNGNNYSFSKPADSLFSANHLNNPQPPPTTSVTAERIPGNLLDHAHLHFERTGVTVGSTPVISFFHTAQIDYYPVITTSTTPIYITITEYGNIGEYIAGNFSGVMIGPPPTYFQSNVTCSFRVKRRV